MTDWTHNRMEMGRSVVGAHQNPLLLSFCNIVSSLLVWIHEISPPAFSGFQRILAQMNEDNEDPSQAYRFYVNQALDANIVDLGKKRKLQAEQLGLPLPKHKCRCRIIEQLKKKQAAAEFYAQKTRENAEAKATDEFSDPFISNHSEMASTSSSNLPHSSLMETCSGKEEESVGGDEDEDYYMYSEYVQDENELYGDEEIENICLPDELKSKLYAVSSGRWSVEQEATQGTRKPTIDQEFEQYFSMLML